MEPRKVDAGRRGLALVGVIGLFALIAGAGASAAAESDTVGTFWRGLWWSVSLMMTEGFIGDPPTTTAGAVISVLLMLTGFAMLSVLSATLASLFVRSAERPQEERDAVADQQLLVALRQVLARLDDLEQQVAASRRREDELGDSATRRPDRT